jgi:hypothetical protein
MAPVIRAVVVMTIFDKLAAARIVEFPFGVAADN